MIRSFRLLICSIILMGMSIYSLGSEPYASSDVHQQVEPVQAQLIHEEESIQPGRSFWVALHLKIDDDWHAYWKNPGDAGMPPEIDWNLPANFSVTQLQWPTPQRFVSDSLVSFGYEKDVTLMAEITPGKFVNPGRSIDIKANVSWVVCSDMNCLPGSAQVNLQLPVAKDLPKANVEATEHFAMARANIPKKAPNLRVHRKDGMLDLHINHERPVTHAYFCPEHEEMIAQEADAVVVPGKGGSYHIVLKDHESKAKTLKGVLVLLDEKDPNRVVAAFDVDVPVSHIAGPDSELVSLADTTAIQEFQPSNEYDFNGGFLLALASAFLGGIILNLMPCVLPVISFKVMSFIKMAGKSRSLIFRHGVAFSLGVLISFWVLAGAMLLLQTYGRSVGWGFQLQEPIFVAVLAAVIMVFGLSLFGVFEVGAAFMSYAGKAQGKSEGLTGSFLSGVLATTVATPCTGPFLGSAIGFAVSLPPALALLIFTALGLGMASPYLLLGAFPSLLRFLPKPGPWMVTFKEIMGFIMLATVLWLVWIFGAQTDSSAVFYLLLSFFCLGVGGWIYGKWGTPVKPRKTRIISYVATVICLVSAGYIISGLQTDEADVWETFSAERVQELHAQGKPVIVDFTAKWCAICQVNHRVLNSSIVSKKLDELGVVRMKADWTKYDPAITQELRKLGRAAVPLYVLYGKDPSQPPVILPQVLTTSSVVAYLDEIEQSDA